MRYLLLSLLLLSPGFASAAYYDVSGPTVSQVSPLSATYTVPAEFSVTADDVSGVANCTLVVSSIYETPMVYDAAQARWETTYTFTTYRSANSIRAKCTDTLGYETMGPSRVISVASAPVETNDGASEVDATGWSSAEVIAASPVLVKTVCPGGEDFTHPCRTVYFLDNHGRRHAFPNEKAYFTWYTDFSNIHLVTNAMMASFPIGPNVTYHPGTKMVKFPTLPAVYVVARYGRLRMVGSEAAAAALYGANWNQQIDDISEAFYGNYTFGSAVNSSLDFNVTSERNSVTSINDNYVLYDDLP